MPQDDIALLKLQADRLQSADGLGRSAKMKALFAYLLEQSLHGRQPKETEIAIEVFGKDAAFDPTQDAAVRVYVHKLRHRLGRFYSENPEADGYSLTIPPGEYRLAVEHQPHANTDSKTKINRPIWLAMAGVLLIAGLIGGWAIGRFAGGRDDSVWSQAAAAPMWHKIAANGRPTIFVLGDYYLVAEKEGGQTTRLVREFSVDSRHDLESYLAMHPDKVGRYEDSSIRYLPRAIGHAMARILPIVTQGRSDAQPKIILASQLEAETLRTSNIIYIGYFSGLGYLSETIGSGSRFVPGPSFDDLIDTTTENHYQGQEFDPFQPSLPYREYGVLTSVSGPEGNRIVVIAGTRDVAVRQVADLAAGITGGSDDPLSRLMKTDAEALIEVTGLRGLNIDGSFVAGGPLDPTQLWHVQN